MGFFSRLFERGIHSAIKNGDIKKLRQLLTDGTDPNQARRHKTPLMIAAHSANIEAVALLLDRGAELEARDYQGSTALMIASAGWGYRGPDKEAKCVEVVKTLLARGADPNACGKRGQTAMRYALGAGNRRVMEVLRTHGAKDTCYPAVSTTEHSGTVPLESH